MSPLHVAVIDQDNHVHTAGVSFRGVLGTDDDVARAQRAQDRWLAVMSMFHDRLGGDSRWQGIPPEIMPQVMTYAQELEQKEEFQFVWMLQDETIVQVCAQSPDAPTHISEYEHDGFTAMLSKTGTVFISGYLPHSSFWMYESGIFWHPRNSTPKAIPLQATDGEKVIQICSSKCKLGMVTEKGNVFFLVSNNATFFSFPDQHADYVELKRHRDEDNTLSVRLKAPENFCMIAFGHDFMLALTKNGQLFHYSFSEPSSTEIKLETSPRDKIVYISAKNSYYACITSSGKLFTCGGSKTQTFLGYLGHGASDVISKPTQVPNPNMDMESIFSTGNANQSQALDIRDRFFKVVCGTEAMFALTETGEVWACGLNKDQRLGFGFKQTKRDGRVPKYPYHQYNLVKIEGFGGKKIFDIDSCGIHSLAVDEDGNLWRWGMQKKTQQGFWSETKFFDMQETTMLPNIKIKNGVTRDMLQYNFEPLRRLCGNGPEYIQEMAMGFTMGMHKNNFFDPDTLQNIWKIVKKEILKKEELGDDMDEEEEESDSDEE